MLDALKEVVSFIGMLIDFIVQIITGLIQLLKLIPSMVYMLTQSLGLLPTFLVGFATVSITVSVIFIIVGRQGGGSD